MNQYRSPSRGGKSAAARAEIAAALRRGESIRVEQPNWQRCPDCGKTGPHTHSGPNRPMLASGEDAAILAFDLNDVIDAVLAARARRGPLPRCENVAHFGCEHAYATADCFDAEMVQEREQERARQRQEREQGDD